MWFAFAILASFFWGITYVFEEQVYKHISVISSLAVSFLTAGIVFGLVALITGVWKKDLVTLTSSKESLMLLALVTITTIIAELGIGFSINDKHATLAGLIEISYPLFIGLFSFIFFRENNLNPGTIFGGLLIFLGVASIYFFNR